jgi:dienelactone hydrolase
MPATIVPKSVSYQSGGKSIPTALFLPTTGQSDKLVILAYGSDGLIDKWKMMLEEFARDLAQAGIAAAIPDYFASTGTRAGDLNPRNPDSYVLQIVKGQATWLAALQAAVSELAKPTIIPGIQPARVGLLGFSLGGYLCAQAAPAVPAMVLFYAPLMSGLHVTSPVSTRVEMHHGGQDPLLSYERDAKGIQNALRQAGATVKLWPAYTGANHGFVGFDPANLKARQLSKRRTLAFFAANL